MDALDMLRQQIEWGADEALDEAPVDRLRPVPAVPVAAPPQRQEMARAVAPPAGTPVEQAIRAAARAGSLDELKGAIAGFEGDPLRDMATNMVFATGDAEAGLLVIGGTPGADEDRSGMPFSGREGVLLDQMLASVGLRRGTMLLAPVIPWRPPGGRAPNPGELQLYRPFLMRLIALVGPSRIVLLGPLPASTVLGPGQRGRGIAWIETTIEGMRTPVLVLPALGDLIRAPARRKDAWTGLRLLRRALDGDKNSAFGTPAPVSD